LDIGILESILILTSLSCAFWVFFDIRRKNVKHIQAIFWFVFTLVFFFPLSFLIYLLYKRYILSKKK